MFTSKAQQQQSATIRALNTAQATLTLNLEGTILDANANFLEALGYELPELQGKPHRQLVDKDYARSDDYADFWRQLRGGERFQGSYVPVLDKSGKPARVTLFGLEAADGGDKQAIIDAINTSQATIEFTLDGIILIANQNFLGAVGYELAEIQGQHHRMFVDADYARSLEYEDFWRTLRSGKYQAAEYRRIGKGGREIWIQASYNPIFDKRGNPFKVVKFATDITAQVHMRTENERIKNVVKDNIGTVSSAVAETSSIISHVASGSQQLNESVEAIARNMKTSQDAVSGVVEQATAAEASVKKLEKASDSMTSVVTLIENIAERIALLALNAAIEAARAGEAGRGFSVVADEVKKLAAQTTEATAQISSEIATMQTTTTEVVTALSAINGSVGHVMESVTLVAGATDQQSATAGSIAESMREVESAVGAINASIMDIARETGAL
jgi:methyl-accepting chemotaxis protein